MDVAVVTGASSGLGLAISNKLLSLGFKVYGLGGNYTDGSLQNSGFIPLSCDLADPAMVEHMAGEILKKDAAISVLVNNAKLYPAESFNDGAGGEFAQCLNINLLCPLILARAFLPGLQKLQGKVITISPATPETSRGGPAGAATAGGLRWMHETLFQQYRDSGVSFTTISPEPNRWRPADSPKAKGGSSKTTLDPAAISDAIAQVILNTSGNLLTEIVIRPERLTETGIPAMREVPYPKPQPIPYTVPRELIEAEEIVERDEEDLEFQPKRRTPNKRSRKKEKPSEDIPDEPTESSASERSESDTNDGEEKTSRRRRRRRGRRRGRSEDDNSSPRHEDNQESDSKREESSPRDNSRENRRQKPQRDETAVTPVESSTNASDSSSSEAKPARRRRRGRKPRPMDGAEKPGFFDRPSNDSAQPKPTEPAKTPKPTAAAEKPAPAEKPPVTTETAKKASKKTAKKATKKTAKKAATKKAAKKASTKKAASATKKPAKKATKKTAKKAAKKTTRKKVAQKSVDTAAE